MIRTIAPQQGHMAAGARPCGVLGSGYQLNASVEVAKAWFSTMQDTTTKRPARRLGGSPT